MAGNIICQIGKSDAKKTAELNAYKKEITDYVKQNIDSYIRSKVIAEINGGN